MIFRYHISNFSGKIHKLVYTPNLTDHRVSINLLSQNEKRSFQSKRAAICLKFIFKICVVRSGSEISRITKKDAIKNIIFIRGQLYEPKRFISFILNMIKGKSGRILRKKYPH